MGDKITFKLSSIEENKKLKLKLDMIKNKLIKKCNKYKKALSIYDYKTMVSSKEIDASVYKELKSILKLLEEK